MTTKLKAKRLVLNINTDCPSGEAECIVVWKRTQEQNLVKEKGKDSSMRFILPSSHMRARIYEHPPLLPLATARAAGLPNNQNPPFAFKFVFCPVGLKFDVHRQLAIEPSFADGHGFLKNAAKFMKYRFLCDKSLPSATRESSSIWLLGINKTNGEWRHQTLGGVICITSVAAENAGHASFVHFVAVQELSHDFIESENHPQISPEDCLFDPGADFPLLTELLTDCFGALQETSLGSGRMGVMLLSIVQQLSLTQDHACHLHLQSLKQTFACRRCMRLGFKCSVLHRLKQDGSPNTLWPGCRSRSDLPPNLRARVLKSCCCGGKGEIHHRLLVLSEPLRELCPPTETCGSPRDMTAERKKAFLINGVSHACCQIPFQKCRVTILP
jgi:hypothetical protein